MFLKGFFSSRKYFFFLAWYNVLSIFKEKTGQISYLPTVSKDNLPSHPLLHIIALERHSWHHDLFEYTGWNCNTPWRRGVSSCCTLPPFSSPVLLFLTTNSDPNCWRTRARLLLPVRVCTAQKNFGFPKKYFTRTYTCLCRAKMRNVTRWKDGNTSYRKYWFEWHSATSLLLTINLLFIFHLLSPSGRTMVLASIQPRTRMNIRDISCGTKVPVHWVTNLTTFMQAPQTPGSLRASASL